MADLAFNTEELCGTAKVFRENAESMLKLKDDLRAKIQDLKDVNWKSTGGAAFQELYEDNWSKNVEKYGAMLKEMARMLDDAAKDYEALADKASQLIF